MLSVNPQIDVRENAAQHEQKGQHKNHFKKSYQDFFLRFALLLLFPYSEREFISNEADTKSQGPRAGRCSSRSTKLDIRAAFCIFRAACSKGTSCGNRFFHLLHRVRLVTLKKTLYESICKVISMCRACHVDSLAQKTCTPAFAIHEKEKKNWAGYMFSERIGSLKKRDSYSKFIYVKPSFDESSGMIFSE